MFAGVHLTSNKLEVTFYQLGSPKMAAGSRIRVVVLADLHNHEFGRGNEELVSEVKRLEPDIIVMAGDMIDKNDDNIEVAVDLCLALNTVAPLYYGLGNHETTMIYVNEIMLHHRLEAEGITVLINRSVEAKINDTPLLIGGLTAGSREYEIYGKEFIDEYVRDDRFKLLIGHSPDVYYEKMADAVVDLGICGHFHGGQIQIPFLGGLYSPDYGFFPKYCNGMFQLNNGMLFVTRGLGNTRRIPRINNRPELAVIDISQQPEDNP